MLRYRLHSLLLLVTAVAGIALCFRPVPIVAEYYLVLPPDLPPTVMVSGGLGSDPIETDATELYRHWHRKGWEEYATRFLCSPTNDCPEDNVDLESDEDQPAWKYWLVDFESKAQRKGFDDCRDALRKLVDRYGERKTREKLRVCWPKEDNAKWAEFAWAMGYSETYPW